MSERIPGPRDPLGGVFLKRRLRADPLRFSLEMAQQYGDIVFFRVGRTPTLLVNHPDLIHQVLVTDARLFRRSPKLLTQLRRFDGHSLLASEGEVWRAQRQALHAGFCAAPWEVFAKRAREATRHFLSEWPAQGIVEVTDEMAALSMEVLSQALLGRSLEPEMRHWLVVILAERSDAVCGGTSLLQRVWGARRRETAHAQQQLCDAVDKLLIDIAGKPSSRDSLAALLLHPEGDQHHSLPPLTPTQVREEVLGLFYAGQDSLSAALAWILYLVAGHPPVQTRLREELAKAACTHATATADAAAGSCHELVVQEALRLYPPNWFLVVREAVSAVDLGKYRIPAGSQLLIVPYVVHRDPRWFPSPNEFLPDRFASGAVAKIPAGAFLPFGLGPRICVGKPLSLLLLKNILNGVIEAFSLELPSPPPVVQPVAQLVIRPHGGLRLHVTRQPEPLPKRSQDAASECVE